MKVSSIAFAACLTMTPAIAVSAAQDDCARGTCKDAPRMATAFEIARQYSNGGKFGGVTPGTTGKMTDIARASVDRSGALEFYASPWRIPPAVAKGQ